MNVLFFDNWESLGRTFIITILAYVVLIAALRSSGKRTLSKMNAFDFIVTIALGSSLATVALNKSVPLADGALAFFLLIYLQYAITWLSVRQKKVKSWVTSRPTLLLYNGQVIDDALKEQRITIEEIHASARKKGIIDLGSVDAIVLEATGDVTVIQKTPESTVRQSTLADVGGHPPEWANEEPTAHDAEGDEHDRT